MGLVPVGPNPNVPSSCCFVVLFFPEVSVCCLFEAVTLSPSCTGAVCSVSTLTICLRLYLINVKPPVLSWNSIVWTKHQVSVWRFLELKGLPSMIYFLKEGAVISDYSLINTLKATFTTLPQIRFKKCTSLYTQYFLELVLHFLIFCRWNSKVAGVTSHPHSSLPVPPASTKEQANYPDRLPKAKA